MEQEKYFRDLMHRVNLCALILDLEGRIVYCNPCLLSLTGYSEEEVIGADWFSTFIPGDQPDMKKIHARALETGKPEEEYISPILTRDQKPVYIKWNNSVLRDHHGNTVAFTSIGENISDQVQAETALVLNVMQFQTLAENAPVGIFKTNAEGKTIYVNPKWCEISMWRYNDALDDGWIKAVHPDDRERLLESWSRAVKQKAGSNEHYRFLRPDHSITWVYGQSTPIFDPKGELTGYIGTITDITEQKLGEEALARSEEKFQKAFKNSPDAITISRAVDGLFVEVNDSMIRLSGYSREEIIGMSTLGLALWVDQDEREKFVTMLMEHGRVYEFESKFRTKQGLVGDYLVSGELFDMDGEKYILGIIRDVTDKKKYTELLEYQSNLLRQMGEVARIGGWEFDPLTGQGTWTEEVAKIHDMELRETTNLEMGLSFYKGEDRKIIERAMKDAIDYGKPFDLELQFVSAKGTFKWVHTIGNPVLKDGKTVRVRGSFQDITDRKMKEEEMLRREILLRNAVENLPLVFYVIDQQGKFLLSTGAGLQGLGLKPDEVTGQSVFDIYKDYPVVLEAIERTLSGGPDHFFVTINESSYDNYLVPLKNLRGERDGLVGVAMDISEGIRSEKKIREAEIRYRRFFENVQDVFYQIDLQGNIIEISPSIYKLSGYTREELIGKPAEIFYADPAERDKLVEKVFVEKEVWDYEAAMKTKDGSTRYASLNAHIMVDEEARPAGMEGTLRDIQERKAFEADLISAKERAEESDRLKTAFLQNISHEIRTPMNAIIGFTSILKDHSHSQDDKDSYLKIVQDSSNQLLSIIDDIVNISAIEANLAKTESGEVNINATLNSLLKQFSLKAAEKKIGIGYHAPLSEEESEVKTDPTKLVQILSNLLNNAFKFTESGKVNFGYERKGPNLEFYVTDSGTGIAPEEHSKIFNTFYQVKHANKELTEGTGLGLAICKAYVGLLGGKIWLKSKPGQGSSFYFTIPYRPVQPGGISGTGKEEKEIISFSRDYRILVAEDDDGSFKLIEMYLTMLGARVIRASDGKEAVTICREKEPPDLVLMDIKMPGMNGYEAITEIRKFLPDLPVIAQTAYADDEKRAVEAGFNAFLGKPFSNALMVEKIKQCMKKADSLNNDTPI